MATERHIEAAGINVVGVCGIVMVGGGGGGASDVCAGSEFHPVGSVISFLHNVIDIRF